MSDQPFQRITVPDLEPQLPESHFKVGVGAFPVPGGVDPAIFGIGNGTQHLSMAVIPLRDKTVLCNSCRHGQIMESAFVGERPDGTNTTQSHGWCFYGNHPRELIDLRPQVCNRYSKDPDLIQIQDKETP